MRPRKDWTTWIYSSFIIYFKLECLAVHLPVFSPGELRDPNVNDFAEIRMDGPLYNEVTRGYWRIEISIALLLTMIADESDAYKLQNTAGQLLNMFDKDIPIYRYNSDKTLLGCMRLVPSRNSKIVQSVFNQFQPALPVLQSSIEAQYYMNLCYDEDKLQP